MNMFCIVYQLTLFLLLQVFERKMRVFGVALYITCTEIEFACRQERRHWIQRMLYDTMIASCLYYSYCYLYEHDGY